MPDTSRRGGRFNTTEIPRGLTPANDELIAFCPKCSAFETLWFAGDVLIPTRKFFQNGNQIYHDCGAEEPCRLLMRFLK